MCKFKIEKYTMPLVWAQKMEYVRNGRTVKAYSKNCEIVNIGEPIGPFILAPEVHAETEISLATISKILKGVYYAANGFHLYHEGEREYVFNIPDTEYAKQNDLLLKPKHHTEETLLTNLNICGFKNSEIIEFKHSNSIIRTKCCNVNCHRTTEKSYSVLVLNGQAPLCKRCGSIVKTAKKPKNYKEKSLFDVRPELLKYYKPELNNDKQPNEISAGSSRVTLCCDKCNKISDSIPHNLTAMKQNGKYVANFKCSKCK